MERRGIRILVAYCDDYAGYTLRAWLSEALETLLQEYCVEPVVDSAKQCIDDYEASLIIDGEPVLLGLPGEEGYLIEVLKTVLEAKEVEKCPPSPE